ncbi:MAG: hypothetical protein HY043_18205 [Verrucomicrobia bacterium]|nr:hypothetical protein [Verrucomicrobiota bacterium]
MSSSPSSRAILTPSDPGFDSFFAACLKHHGFVNPALAALLTGRSRVRIYQLIANGTFAVHRWYGYQLISVSQLAHWYRQAHPCGRPRKLP